MSTITVYTLLFMMPFEWVWIYSLSFVWIVFEKYDLILCEFLPYCFKFQLYWVYFSRVNRKSPCADLLISARQILKSWCRISCHIWVQIRLDQLYQFRYLIWDYLSLAHLHFVTSYMNNEVCQFVRNCSGFNISKIWLFILMAIVNGHWTLWGI